MLLFSHLHTFEVCAYAPEKSNTSTGLSGSS